MADPGICVLCLADTCTSEVRTQCSILLHLMDICFLTCIYLWQISQIQTFLFKVVGPGFFSTSHAFVSSSASHPVGPYGRHAQKTVNRAGRFDTICIAAWVRCDSSSACRLCRLESLLFIIIVSSNFIVRHIPFL